MHEGRVYKLAAMIAVLGMLLAACSSGSEETQEDSTDEATVGSDEIDDESSETEAPSDDGEAWTFTMAVGTEIPNIDPHRNNTGWIKLLHYGNVSETLVAIDPAGELLPLLATDWEVVEPSTWRFNLREGISFHNGEPMNAEAVAFSIDRVLDPATEATHIGFFSAINADDPTEVVDEYTIDINTNGPQPFLPGSLTFLPIVPPEYSQSAEDALRTQGIGTGPYTMDPAEVDRVVLNKNPDYWGGAPSGPDQVVLVARPEDSSRISGLQAGEFDMVTEVPLPLVENVPAITSATGPAILGIQLNSSKLPFDDPLLREAAVLAVDNETIRTSLMGDFATAARCQYVVEGVAGFNDDLEIQPFDPDRAAELLDEAGYDGTPVRISAPVGRYVEGESIIEVVAQQWRDVGFEVEVITLPFDDWLDSIFQPLESRVEAYILGASFDSGSVAQPWSLYVSRTDNFGNFPYDEYQDTVDLAEQAVSTLDEAERTELLDQASAEICEANPVIWTHAPDLLYGHAENISMPERNDERVQFVDVQRAG